MDWFFLSLSRFIKHVPKHVQIACAIAFGVSAVLAAFNKYKLSLLFAVLPIMGFAGFSFIEWIGRRMMRAEAYDKNPELAAVDRFVKHAGKRKSSNPNLPGIAIAALGCTLLIVAYAITRAPKWQSNGNNNLSSSLNSNYLSNNRNNLNSNYNSNYNHSNRNYNGNMGSMLKSIPTLTPKPTPEPTPKPTPQKMSAKQCHDIILTKRYNPDIYLPADCDEEYRRWKDEDENFEERQAEARRQGWEREQAVLREEQRQLEDQRRQRREDQKQYDDYMARKRREQEQREQREREKWKDLGNSIGNMIRRRP